MAHLLFTNFHVGIINASRELDMSLSSVYGSVNGDGGEIEQ